MTNRSASAVGLQAQDGRGRPRRGDVFLKFVPSGVATVAELQGKGFAYLKVG